MAGRARADCAANLTEQSCPNSAEELSAITLYRQTEAHARRPASQRVTLASAVINNFLIDVAPNVFFRGPSPRHREETIKIRKKFPPEIVRSPPPMTTRSIAGQRACLRAVTKAVWKRVELHTPLLANLFHEPRRGLRFAHAAPDRAGRVADAYPRCHRQRGTHRDWALDRLLQCSPTRTPRSVAGRPMRSMLSNKNWRNWRRKHRPDPP